MPVSASLQKLNGVTPPGHGKLWTPSDTIHLRRLAELGYGALEIADELKSSVERVRQKAAALGLPPLPERVAVKRPCLRCRKPFLSRGKHNRLCDDCHEYAARQSPWAPF